METTLEIARKNPKVTSESSENRNINLPEEIITDIISRLPVKHAFQSQCLSKNFSSITNDISFINAHLEHSARLRPSLILNKGNDIYMIQSYRLDSETIVEEVPLRTITDSTDSTAKLNIEASCNGLVICSIGDSEIFIWNPATMQCNNLPNTSYVKGTRAWTAEWGFDYCTKSSQYKVVKIACYRDYSIWGGEEVVVEVLSYGRDCKWRRLDFSKFDVRCNGPGITVRGVVYWTLMYDYRLLSFDLEEEEFAWIIFPCGGFEQIMEFQGSLAACKPSGINGKAFDIYVLNDAGNVDSWEIICTTGDIFPSLPVRFLNDHQLFLVDGRKDIFGPFKERKYSWSLYDLEREEIRRTPQASANNSPVVLNFVESMVALLP